MFEERLNEMSKSWSFRGVVIRMIILKLTSRKFFAFIISVLMVAWFDIDPIYAITLLFAYAGVNVGQKILERKK